MTNLKLSKDFNDFNNHELKVAEAAIKQQKDLRDKIFMSQFHEGTPIAVTTSNLDENDDYMIYPAYITKVNKKSIKISYSVNSDYSRKPIGTREKTWKIDAIAKHVQGGYLHKSFPSSWNGSDNQYKNYPSTGASLNLPKEWL